MSKIGPKPPAAPSTLLQKLGRFDTNQDGKLSFKESMDVFESVGLPKGWSFASALGTAIARGPIGLHQATPADLAHPGELLSIDLRHIQDTVLKGQSGAWDTKTGNADPAKARAFISEVQQLSGSDGRIRLEGIRARVERDVTASVEGMSEPSKSVERKRRFGESYSAWVVLMELAGQPDASGGRSLSAEQVGHVFDGTLFDMLQAQHSGHVSVARMALELAWQSIKA